MSSTLVIYCYFWHIINSALVQNVFFSTSQLLQCFDDLLWLNDNDIDVNLLWKDSSMNRWKRSVLTSHVSFNGNENTQNELNNTHTSLIGLHHSTRHAATALNRNYTSIEDYGAKEEIEAIFSIFYASKSRELASCRNRLDHGGFNA